MMKYEEYDKKNCGKTIVIKYGGHALLAENLRRQFMEGVIALRKADYNCLIVHGGGPQIDAQLKKQQIVSVFKNGLRVTDEKTMEVVEMTLCGSINKKITRLFIGAGVMAAGISGIDGRLLTARQKDPALGKVGEVVSVDSGILLALLNGGIMPVVAPVALDEACEPININADSAAAAIAGKIQAEAFILISDVPGVLDGQGRVIPILNYAQCEGLRASGVIHGGMIPKIEACESALNQGCKQAIILDGNKPGSLAKILLQGDKPGTVIVK